MVPIMYIFIKNLFGTRLASFGTPVLVRLHALCADEDSHRHLRCVFYHPDVLFHVPLYFLDFRDRPAKQLIPLALCGISFGLGIASKWTAFYAAAGLVVLYVIYIVLQGLALCREGLAGHFAGRLVVILLVSIVFFVAVPAAIYCLSYIPYAKGMGEPLSLSLVWENQVSMFNYHAGVDAEHSYSSRWWMWIFDIRPILYYRSIRPRLPLVYRSISQPDSVLGRTMRDTGAPLEANQAPRRRSKPLHPDRICGAAGTLDVHFADHVCVSLFPLHGFSRVGPVLYRGRTGQSGSERQILRVQPVRGGHCAVCIVFPCFDRAYGAQLVWPDVFEVVPVVAVLI